MYKENEVNQVYLSIKQHDQFRTLLMGFEIPFRGYIADVLMTHYSSANDLETALLAKNASLTPADPFFLRDVLPNSVKHSKIEKMYNTFSTASLTTEIVAVDQDMPMVGALNIITFALTGNFNDLYSLFTDYSTFCDLAEKYRYARNKIDHPGCRTLEDNHLVPVLSFVKDITLQLVTSRSVFQAFLNRQADLGRSGAYYWQVQYIHPESISALTSGLEEWSLNNSYGLPQGVISANYNSLAMGGLQRFGMLLQILCTGFVLLLCLVCMANIHNSLSTGMELRAREYGILRSVGITPVDFRKMIWLESLFYGIKALCWSLPFGMGVLALEYYAIRRAFQLPFCLPVGSIVLAVVLVMGVCWISGLLTRRSLEEQTITEAIQKRLF